jgi:hypothetical protein
MATFVEGKVDLMILIDDFGKQESHKNVCHICLVFNVVLFMFPKTMFTMVIVLSKFQYTRSLFQILMGSIRMSRQGGIRLLVTT